MGKGREVCRPYFPPCLAGRQVVHGGQEKELIFYFSPFLFSPPAVLIGMTKSQAIHHRKSMNAALVESTECQSLGVAAVRSCLETALAHCKALADGGQLRPSDRYEVTCTRTMLREQGFAV